MLEGSHYSKKQHFILVHGVAAPSWTARQVQLCPPWIAPGMALLRQSSNPYTNFFQFSMFRPTIRTPYHTWNLDNTKTLIAKLINKYFMLILRICKNWISEYTYEHYLFECLNWYSLILNFRLLSILSNTLYTELIRRFSKWIVRRRVSIYRKPNTHTKLLSTIFVQQKEEADDGS